LISSRKEVIPILEDALLATLIWFGGGYLCGEFIIRWNQRHLLGNNVSPKKHEVARLLNADLTFYGSGKLSHLSRWRVTLTLMGPITMTKAALLLLFGWRA